jgi:hypothetical protein
MQALIPAVTGFVMHRLQQYPSFLHLMADISLRLQPAGFAAVAFSG